jgi:5-oxopent-3-ene-1,2,5-tricarboxylate decarboxylase / 2-hydroxyhepta-2,4-diene-1,7-dioate isomerase
MSVLTGEREEWRRILYEGQPKWVRPADQTLILGDGRQVAEAEAVYLPPCEPTKIICVHLNYESRRMEFGAPEQVTPTYFQKPTTALNSHRGVLNRPADCQYLNYEGEVGVVVGKPMRNLRPEETWNYLAGFVPANDVGCHDFRDTDMNSMLRVKGMDGFSPIGPGIVRGVDIRKATLRTYVNGKPVQHGNIGEEMLFSIDYLLADLCRHITLLPGDLILTGTPANSRPMKIGDVVEVEVSGVGRLSNTVAETPAPANRVGHQPTDSEPLRRVALGGDFKPSK